MKTLFLVLLLSYHSFADSDLEHSPRFFTHILDYIAVDYPGAVQNGKVVSKEEYEEQVEFSHTVNRLANEIDDLKNAPDIQKDLKTLSEEILSKASPEKVSGLARNISQRAVVLCKIQNVPSRWPNLHRGKDHYDKNCAQCHGNTGKGDGPSGTSLDPKPANFHAEKLDGMPPFQLFNAIRLGVPGTAMASFSHFSDQETWDLAFYVLSLRHGNGVSSSPKPSFTSSLSLSDVSLKSDSTLRQEKQNVSEIRLLTGTEESEIKSLTIAEDRLRESLAFYKSKKADQARTSAIVAYLDGIEPVEPRLRAKDYAFTQYIEKKFADVRASIEKKETESVIEQSINAALKACSEARDLLKPSEGSSALTFSVAAGIFIREGFEAALILITLLGIVRSVGAPQAALSIHLGWISALGFGTILWFFSGWILGMSGAQRELIEGVVSGLAVIVLLYFGFWLHRKTEIGRWRHYINEMTAKAVSKKNLFALGAVAFMGVFRECFETVLFLRALLIESGPNQGGALLAGVLSSFLLVLVFSMLLIKQSAKVPVRRLFQMSSIILVFLALILVGKMMHSFQETGIVGVTPVSLPIQSEILGVFPTVETLISQAIVFGGIILIAFLSGVFTRNGKVS